MGPPIGLHGFVENKRLPPKKHTLTLARPLNNTLLAVLWALRPNSGTPIGLQGFYRNYASRLADTNPDSSMAAQ